MRGWDVVGRREGSGKNGREGPEEEWQSEKEGRGGEGEWR